MATSNRRKFLAAGGALAAVAASNAEADPPRMNGLYIHGMFGIANSQLP
jgi:hypothetical protein